MVNPCMVGYNPEKLGSWWWKSSFSKELLFYLPGILECDKSEKLLSKHASSWGFPDCICGKNSNLKPMEDESCNDKVTGDNISPSILSQ